MDRIPSDVWSKQKATQWYSNCPPICGCNYLPRTAVNTTEMWQADTFHPQTIDQELGWAEAAGYNSVRVFLQYLVWEAEPDAFLRRVDEFLTIANQRGVTTTLVLFCDCAFSNKEPYLGKQDDPIPGVHNSGWTPSPGLKRVGDRSQWTSLKKYVQAVVGAFGADARILVWDLYNEPGNSRMGERSLPLLEAAFEWAREMRPAQPLTTGVWAEWDSPMSQRIIERSDIVSFHSYGRPKDVSATIDKCQATGRPTICTEWLRRQVGSSFSATLPVFARRRVGWYHWGLVAGRTQTYLHWGSKAGDPMPGIWQHDTFHGDGTSYDPTEIEWIQNFTRRWA